MVSSVRAGMIAQEKEKKRQTRLAEQGITTPPEVVVKAIIEQNPLEVLEVIENVEPKAEQSTKEKTVKYFITTNGKTKEVKTFLGKKCLGNKTKTT